jgi:hypothetical protein
MGDQMVETRVFRKKKQRKIHIKYKFGLLKTLFVII